MSSLVGKYELLTDPGDQAYDQFLQAMGVSEAQREAGRLVVPSVEISAAGDRWSVKTLSDLLNEESLFTPGVKTPTQLSDVEVVSLFTIESGNKLVQRFTTAGQEGKVVFETTADGMTTVLTFQGKVAVRKYKRVA
ncbi:lipocalin/fatty-acid binding family protein [Streptomyces sp. NPDC054995]